MSESLSRDRRICTRRAALKRVSLLAGIAVAGGLLAACQQQAPAPAAQPTSAPAKPTEAAKPAAPAATTAPAAAPTTAPAVSKPDAKPTTAPASSAAAKPASDAGAKAGGELRYTMAAFDPVQLDPHQTVFGEDIYTVSPAYNNLVYLNFYEKEPYTIDPDLAERWEVSPDGLTYTFFLRKGVLWHDGKPFTAADAKYSLDRVRNPPAGMVSPRQGQLEMVDSTTTPDDFTLVVKLKSPSASLLQFLAQETMPIVPKHIGEADQLKGTVIGTGPFKLEKWEKGQSVSYVKNDKYFKPGLPYLDKVTRFIFRDPRLAISAFMSGQVDFMGRRSGELTRSEVAEVKSRMPQVVMKESGEMTEVRAILNGKREGPLKDVRVRKAISMALDRKAIFDVTVDGYGTPHGIVPSWDPTALPPDRLQKIAGFAPDMAANKAEAKKLLAEAGFPNGFTVKSPFTLKSPKTEAQAVAIMGQLRDLGITGELDSVDPNVYYTRGTTGDWDMLLGANAYTMTHLEYVIREYFLPEAGRNWGQVNSTAENTNLFRQYVAELDKMKKQELGYQLQEAIMGLYVYVPVGTPGAVFVQAPYVKNYQPPYTQSTYDNLKFERVWLDK